MHRSISHETGSMHESAFERLDRTGDILEELQESWDDYRRNRQTQFSMETNGGDEAAADAWHASFGTYVSRALGQGRMAEYMAEVVIGEDDRVRIDNTTSYPFGAVCSLEITASTGRQFVGTGWLANENTVVTAGHCVFMKDQGGWAASIRVIPGRNGANDTQRSASASRLFSVEGWTNDQRPEADYGAIRLETGVPSAGSIGFVVGEDSDLARLRCHVIGYSADKPKGTMWGHVRPLKEVRSNVLVYETDTYGGNSGGPVFYVHGRDVYAVGIHNYGDLSGNMATRITDDVFHNMKRWMNT